MATGNRRFAVYLAAALVSLVLSGCGLGEGTGGRDERVAWFLAQHEDLKARYFVGKFGVDSHPSGWDAGAYLRAYVDLYEATGDPGVLGKLNELLKIVADGNDALTGRIDERTGKVLPGWGTRAYDYGPEGGARYSDMLTNALYAYPLAAFVRIVSERPSLALAFGADAERYERMVRELYRAHDPFTRDGRSPYPDGAEGAYFAYPEHYFEDREDLSGMEAPVNLSAIIAEPLVELYRAAVAAGEVDEAGRGVVERVGHYLWWNMRVRRTAEGDGYLVWYYWPAAPASRIRMEDLTHGARVAGFAVALHDAGLASRWTEERLRLLANTLTCGAYLGEHAFANYLDGTGGVYEDDAATLYEWLALERYSRAASCGSIARLLRSAMEAEGEDERYNLAVFAKFVRYGGE